MKKAEAEAIFSLAGSKLSKLRKTATRGHVSLVHVSAREFLDAWRDTRGEGKQRIRNTRRKVALEPLIDTMMDDDLEEREKGYALAERLLDEAAKELSRK